MANSAKRARPRMFKVSDEVRLWATRLAEEVASWPNVTSRPMFGMIAFYRAKTVFAALPVTRTFPTRNSIVFKFNRDTAETRKTREALAVYEGNQSRTNWLSFELSSPEDITPAISWLDLAYRSAAPTFRKRR
jgi:hypothetical protein